MDTRRDPGQYYPGGKVISTRPVATGGDVKHSDFEDLNVKTNTLPDLRAAVKGLAARLGATVVTALAVCVAIGATVEKAKLNELDFDADPSVVTDVTFEGLATPDDLAAAANELRGEIAGKADATKGVVTTRWRFDATGLILDSSGDDSWAADDANYMQYVADRGVYRWTIAGYGAGLCYGGADAAALTNATGTAYTFTRLSATNQYDVAYMDDVAAAVAPLCTIEAAEAMRAAESNRVDALLGDFLPRTTSAITAAGVTTDYLINSSYAGGIRVRYSSRDLNDYTSYGYRGVTARRNGVGEDWLWDTSDANGIVRRKELAGITTEEIDPTVPAWAKASSKPAYTAAEVGAASSSSVATLNAQVASIGAHLNAEDARFVSTNYNSSVHLPEASVAVNISNEWLTVWLEMTRWNAFTGAGFDWATWCGFNCFRTNVLAQLDQKADRAWGFCDSHTGLWAPEGYTQISSSNILVAAGMGYQRTVTASGTYWVLTANEPYTMSGISSNGYFRIEDADGNVQLEIVKGDKRTVPAPPGGVTVSGSSPYQSLVIRYPVASQPTIEVALSLAGPWHAETSASCPATVTWSGSSGAYVATVTPTVPAVTLFARATYEIGGETYINNRAPVSIAGGILFNGTLYLPRVSGTKLEFVAQ